MGAPCRGCPRRYAGRALGLSLGVHVFLRSGLAGVAEVWCTWSLGCADRGRACRRPLLPGRWRPGRGVCVLPCLSVRSWLLPGELAESCLCECVVECACAVVPGCACTHGRGVKFRDAGEPHGLALGILFCWPWPAQVANAGKFVFWLRVMLPRVDLVRILLATTIVATRLRAGLRATVHVRARLLMQGQFIAVLTHSMDIFCFKCGLATTGVDRTMHSATCLSLKEHSMHVSIGVLK